MDTLHEDFNIQMGYRSKMFSYSLLQMPVIWYYVSNVEYRKTCPFCFMRNGLFTCMPSNSVYLSNWELDQKDMMLYLPILKAKNCLDLRNISLSMNPLNIHYCMGLVFLSKKDSEYFFVSIFL